ncbi:MAG: hypothetical protein ACRDRA_13170, partial [Pseudonocardiaceae bacterium]
IPPVYTNVASATNNVVQRTAGAFGVAVVTAILTFQETQLLTGRTALLPADTPTPTLSPTAPPLASLYAVYRETELRAYTGAMNNLFLLGAALFVVTALISLFMRSGPLVPADAGPPQQATVPVRDGLVKDGVVGDGVVGGRPVSPATPPRNSSPARQADGLVDVGEDAPQRDR